MTGVQTCALPISTVVDDKSVYVYFSPSEQDLMPLIREEDKTHNPRAKVFMSLSDEKDFPHEGYLDYYDSEIDPSTGTLQMRAIFNNESGLFVPGMFVRLRIPVQRMEALLVPDVAIQAGQGGKFVLVVNDKKIVEQRIVKTGQAEDRMRVILHGIDENDWVIINGIRRAREGQPVRPIETQLRPEQANKVQPTDNTTK